MSILLGIDTGGTYTDAVLLDEEKGVLATAKSPTTQEDLTIGIRRVLGMLLEREKPPIHLVSLSSTLATNAVVEGGGHAAALILIGYEPDVLESDAFAAVGSENPVFFVGGGHRISGDEQAPLDRTGLQAAIDTAVSRVSAFAVSGYFGVRNPSHELAAKAVIQENTGLPVTCGHELTSQLDAPRRAATVLLNARLIPLIRGLLVSVERVLSDRGIQAPLMVVKGDGTLIASRTARDVPVETILSGPAASVVGARYLTGLRNALVIDMGGTTSDMAVIRAGAAAVSGGGAEVGGFRPMVASLELLTEGIGGDSWIRIDRSGHLVVGPVKALPLCVMGQRHPEIIDQMKNGAGMPADPSLPLFLQKSAFEGRPQKLNSVCNALLDCLKDGPLYVPSVPVVLKNLYGCDQAVRFLLKAGLASAGSFTPTDATNILGRYRTGSSQAAQLGAGILSANCDMEVEHFCRRVIAHVQRRLASALIRCALQSEGTTAEIMDQAASAYFFDRALTPVEGGLLDCTLSLSCPIAAVGAPAATYFPEVAERLGCRLSIPENAEVANAVGAVTGVISQAVQVLIKPVRGGSAFRVHSSRGVADLKSYAAAEKHAVETAAEAAREKALDAGAEGCEVDVLKMRVESKGGSREAEPAVWVQTEITAVAAGRPRMGRHRHP